MSGSPKKKPAPKSKREFEGGPLEKKPVRPGFPKVSKDGKRQRPNMPT
jgi:hypothetical protein